MCFVAGGEAKLSVSGFSFFDPVDVAANCPEEAWFGVRAWGVDGTVDGVAGDCADVPHQFDFRVDPVDDVVVLLGEVALERIFVLALNITRDVYLVADLAREVRW
ncbi:hypothetical protein RERY_00850 [Rhodococcus erythropolis]|nr:hypothetical protein RERY_00850 [Rhodococcus erythropolis]